MLGGLFGRRNAPANNSGGGPEAKLRLNMRRNVNMYFNTPRGQNSNVKEAFFRNIGNYLNKHPQGRRFAAAANAAAGAGAPPAAAVAAGNAAATTPANSGAGTMGANVGNAARAAGANPPAAAAAAAAAAAEAAKQTGANPGAAAVTAAANNTANAKAALKAIPWANYVNKANEEAAAISRLRVNFGNKWNRVTNNNLNNRQRSILATLKAPKPVGPPLPSKTKGIKPAPGQVKYMIGILKGTNESRKNQARAVLRNFYKSNNLNNSNRILIRNALGLTNNSNARSNAGSNLTNARAPNGAINAGFKAANGRYVYKSANNSTNYYARKNNSGNNYFKVEQKLNGKYGFVNKGPNANKPYFWNKNSGKFLPKPSGAFANLGQAALSNAASNKSGSSRASTPNSGYRTNGSNGSPLPSVPSSGSNLN